MRRVAFFFLILTFLFSSIPGASAHYDDMHYHFTYYMARATGYTPLQAFRIASANVSIDWDEDTEPVQMGSQFGISALDFAVLQPMEVAGYMPGFESLQVLSRYLKKETKESVHMPRIKFHAFMDCYNYKECTSDLEQYNQAIQAIPKNRDLLWNRAFGIKNLGVFLHFFMDEIPHRGYPSDYGHWGEIIGAFHLDLPMGATTDYLSYKEPNRNRKTITDSLNYMKTFMNKMNSKQKSFSKNYNSSDINHVYMRLREVNPITQAPSFLESYAAGGGPVKWKFESDPVYGRSQTVVLRALEHKLGALEKSYPLDHMQYNLDKNGDPLSGFRDSFVLYGNARFVMKLSHDGEKVDSLPEPLKFKLKLDPRLKDVEPYDFAEGESRGEDLVFENLPIGDYILEVTYQGKEVMSRSYQQNKEDQFEDIFFDDDAMPDFSRLYELLERLKELHRLSNEQVELGKALDLELQSTFEKVRKLLEELKSINDDWDTKLADWKKEAEALAEDWARLPGWRSEVTTNAELISEKKQQVEMPRDIVCGFLEDFDPEMEREEFDKMKEEANLRTDEARDKQKTMAEAAEAMMTSSGYAIRFYSRVESLLAELARYYADDGILSEIETLLAKARENLDGITDAHAQVGVYKNEADEIKAEAVGLIVTLREKYKLAEELDEIEKEIKTLYAEIVSFSEHFGDHRTVNQAVLEGLEGDFASLKTVAEENFDKLKNIPVPTVDPGEKEDLLSETEAALILGRHVKAIADETATCNDQLQRLEAEGETEGDRITELNVILEQHSSENGFEEGKTLYMVTAAYTVNLETVESTSIGCHSSKESGDADTSTTVRGFGESSSRLEVHEWNAASGEDINVCCSLLVNNDRVCANARAPESSASAMGDALLAEMEELFRMMRGALENVQSSLSALEASAGDLTQAINQFQSELSTASNDLSSTLAARASVRGVSPSAILDQLGIYTEELRTNLQTMEVLANQNCVASVRVESAASLEEADSIVMGIRTDHGELQRLHASSEEILGRMDVMVQGLEGRQSEQGTDVLSAQMEAGNQLLQQFERLQSGLDELNASYEQIKDLKSEADQILTEAEGVYLQAETERELSKDKDERRTLKETMKLLKKIKKTHKEIDKAVQGGEEILMPPTLALGSVQGSVISVEASLLEADSAIQEASAANEDIVILEVNAQYQEGTGFRSRIQAALEKSDSCYTHAHDAQSEQENAAMQDALDRLRCPEGSNSYPMWDENKREAYCGCLKPNVVGPGDVCMSREDAAMANTSCSHIGLSEKVYNYATGKVDCVCVLKGDIIVPRPSGKGYICSRPEPVNTGGPIPGSRARSLDPSPNRPDMSGVVDALADLARQRQQSRTTYKRPTGGVYDDIFAGDNSSGSSGSSSSSSSSSGSTYMPPAETGTHYAGFGKGQTGQRAVNTYYGGTTSSGAAPLGASVLDSVTKKPAPKKTGLTVNKSRSNYKKPTSSAKNPNCDGYCYPGIGTLCPTSLSGQAARQQDLCYNGWKYKDRVYATEEEAWAAKRADRGY